MSEIIIIIIALAALGGSAFFSGTETGLYQLSRLRVRLGVEQKRLPYVLLGKCIENPSKLTLSILAGNNLFNYILASTITGLFISFGYAEYKAEIFATATLTPILFIFAELLPKHLFYYLSDSLMYTFAPFIYFFHKLFIWTGITPLLFLFSRGFIRLVGSDLPGNTTITAVQRHHVKTIFQETEQEGLLSPVQTDILTRLVSVPNIRLGNVMVPVSWMRTVEVNTNKDSLLEILAQCPYTRLPVYEGNMTNILGYINIYEALCWDENFDNLRGFIKPLSMISPSATVTTGIDLMRKKGHKMLLVAKAVPRRGRKPLGIVTMKDLVEELLGELAEW